MLVAYTVALDLIRSLRSVVEQLKTYDSDSANQVVRAATSITHNLGEGSRRGGKDPKRFYRMAQAAPARSSPRSTPPMRGAGRSTPPRRAHCSIACSPCCGASVAERDARVSLRSRSHRCAAIALASLYRDRSRSAANVRGTNDGTARWRLALRTRVRGRGAVRAASLAFEAAATHGAARGRRPIVRRRRAW